MTPSRDMHRWRNAPYAVIVPKSEQKRDIIPASPSLLRETKYPFGMCITSERIPFYETPLPLIYVSPEAALDRAPHKHSMNGGGVRPGWYAIAQPGRFKVRVTMFDHVQISTKHKEPYHDVIGLKLEVDGLDTRQRQGFFDNDDVRDVVFTGFVEKYTKVLGACNVSAAVLRPFVFEKVTGAESRTEGVSHIGEIRLSVRCGRSQSQIVEPDNQTFDYGKNFISEKLIAKEGRSIQASRSVTQERCLTRMVLVKYERDIEEAGITIFVRERSWLHSRRIIDDYDLPLSYEAFAKMLKADKAWVSNIGIVNVDEEPAKKRRRMKKQMRLTDEVQPIQSGEIIDLT